MQVFIPSHEQARGFLTREIDQTLALWPGGVLYPVDGVASPDAGPAFGWLVPWRGNGFRRGVALLARSGRLRVNGLPVLPVTALERGDEIRVDGMSLYFTDEAPLRVVPYDPASATGPVGGECTRCHGPIREGASVVHCPICGSIYMAQPDRAPNCWEFGPCLSCGRDPQLEFAWEPRIARACVPWAERPWRCAQVKAPLAV